MPDLNKLEALSAAGYVIRGSCGTCKFASIRGTGWGSCSKIQYDHLKHTGDARNASIHTSGWCPSFEMNERAAADLAKSGFDRFKEGGTCRAS